MNMRWGIQMKKIIFLALALTFMLIVVACTETTQTPSTATLYSVMEMGDINGVGQVIDTYDITYEGDLTVEILANGLSELTGYNFSATQLVGAENFTIDFYSDSTLFASDISEIVPKSAFAMEDIPTTYYYILDSLWMTVKENMQVSEISFSMSGGNPLNITLFQIPLGVDYLYSGSTEFSQSLNGGNSNNNNDYTNDMEAFVPTEGLWYSDTGYYYVMDGMGNYTYYDLHGYLMHEGTMGKVDDYAYIIYTQNAQEYIYFPQDYSYFSEEFSGRIYTYAYDGVIPTESVDIVGEWYDGYHDVSIILYNDNTYHMVPTEAFSYFGIPGVGEYVYEDGIIYLTPEGSAGSLDQWFVSLSFTSDNTLQMDNYAYSFIQMDTINQ